uniref:NADH dehydrogenase subunit 11 n=1 Tax=Jakoba bahamiensis TaxID=221721 RepID=M4QL20_9EUKA|nr:NADH dehydrogenase subunit 11 [Jakoba bahamiensis]AGH24148.1 NADH dehydrogenase subunit 11 [Jakoba bahamiensis]
MVKVIIDGIEVQARKNATILQACLDVGVEIPRFCYHERLSIAGNCRMCLVEVEKSPKPVASCAMPVVEGMKVFTNTPLVRKAREGVLEFLLVNHPLDCPICDQGGECDLQDLTMAYGSDRGRFHEYKRGVEDKNLGPLVKTVMTRCIHCTRCVRFSTEIAGVEDLGTVGRGRDTEISTYIEKVFDSELSGNIIDLCPVGALTSKPYAFTARPWELESVESIDISDGIGSNIRIDLRGSEIMRVLPKLNEEINEEWISDKTRFSYDGLKRQRLTMPLLHCNGNYQESSWKESFDLIKMQLETSEQKGGRIIWVLGKQVELETALLVKELSSKFRNSYVTSELMINTSRNVDFRMNYTLNNSLNDLENIDFCLLIGTNPRHEASLLNVRLRKAYLKNQKSLRIGVIGDQMDLTYSHDYLGNDLNVLLAILEGRHLYSKYLFKARNPLILLGDAILFRKDSESFINAFQNFESIIDKKCFGFLNSSSGTVGHMDLGIGGLKVLEQPSFSKNDFVYLCGVDDYSYDLFSGAFLVYQGHHGDQSVLLSDMILPGAAFTEKSATYVNVEGRVQRTTECFAAPGNAREDWKIIRALSEFLGKTLDYQSLEDIRFQIAQYSPKSDILGVYLKNYFFENKSRPERDKIYLSKFTKLIPNFYLTDPVCRASSIMGRCSVLYHVSDKK